ncbi:DUF5994 family protein [Nocardioides sp. BP30]|uniref:DUF5994 family protein n=1 Tax=Nocardioides sp. BP30 TaxID=3036374 RepID=UPI0024692BD6|nr:DUF5994 family protein [Nocardioides sp. BP30]WGL51415.1 DUF5994 family protein [Nocardioides sp. BP30]
MAAETQPTRFVLSVRATPGPFDAVWWPQSRRLDEELSDLFALWPPGAGRIARVLYSPPDWDDRPRSVPVGAGRIKTGCFPDDDTQLLVLSMIDGRRLKVRVIQPDTPAELAAKLLEDAAAGDEVGPTTSPDGSESRVRLAGALCSRPSGRRHHP